MAKLKEIEQKLEKRSSQTVIIAAKDSDLEFLSINNYVLGHSSVNPRHSSSKSTENESEELFNTPPTQSQDDNKEIERLKCLNEKLEKENLQFADDLRRVNNELESCLLEKGHEVLIYKKKLNLLQQIVCNNNSKQELHFEHFEDDHNVIFLENEIEFLCRLNQQLRTELESFERQNVEYSREINALKRNAEEMRRSKIGMLLKENLEQEVRTVLEENHRLHNEMCKIKKETEDATISVENQSPKTNGKLSFEVNRLFEENKYLKEEIQYFYKRFFPESGDNCDTVNISEVIIRNLRVLIKNLHYERDYSINKSKNYRNEVIKLRGKLKALELRKEIRGTESDLCQRNEVENVKSKLNEMKNRLKVLEEASNLLQTENENYIAANNLLKQKNIVLEDFYNRIGKKRGIKRCDDNKKCSTHPEKVQVPNLNKLESEIENLRKANGTLLNDNSILVERVETLTKKLNEKRNSGEMRVSLEKFCKCTANRCTSEVCFKKFTDDELEKKEVIIKQLEESIETSNKLLQECEIEMGKMRNEREVLLKEKQELTEKMKGQQEEINILEINIRRNSSKVELLQKVLENERKSKNVAEERKNTHAERLSVLLQPVIRDLEDKVGDVEMDQHENDTLGD